MQDTPQDTVQDKNLLKIFSSAHTLSELQEMLDLIDRKNFRLKYLQPAIEKGVAMLKDKIE